MTLGDFRKNFGLYLIIAANFVPFYGLLVWGWTIFSVFFLYWAENAIIGVYVLIMIGAIGARQGVLPFVGSIFAMFFFVIHYGMFCMAHLAILTELFRPKIDHSSFQPADIVPLLLSPEIQGFYFAIAGLVVAQALECFYAYATKYYKFKKPEEVMFVPYGRIVVLHIAILVGGLIAQQLGSPVWALAVLIVLKTLYDIAVFKTRGDDERESENPEKI